MAIKRFKTNFPGVRYREHPTRKHGIKKDRYFSIYYRVNGKKREEGIGWASEGWTAQRSFNELIKLKEAHRLGQGPQTLKEKRKIENERREQKERNLLTFHKFFNDYYFPLQKQKRTWKREKEIYHIWIEPVIRNLPLSDVSPFHLEKIKKNMSDAGRAPRTIHYCLAVIRQVFNYARRSDLYYGDNPVSKVKKPVSDNKRIRFLTHEEANMLLRELCRRSPEIYEMALISLHTGLRAGEVFSLTWGDVDIEKGLLFVKDTKSGKNRFAYMTKDVERILSEKTRGRHDDPVFGGRKNNKRKMISMTFPKVVESLGLNKGITDPRHKVVFHTLRHTYASWLVESGVDIYTVKKLMGHSSIAMTERYSHLGQNTLQNAVKTFEKSLRESSTRKVTSLPRTL